MRVLGGPMPRVLELVARHVGLDDRVLEVAAGTGLVTAALQPRAREVLATDQSAAMVAQLEARVRRAGWTNVRTARRDLYALDEGGFDTVVAANVLHLVPDLPRALAGLLAATRPGGALLLPTFCHDEHLLARAVSRALAVTGFPSARRFDARRLRAAITASGAIVERLEVVAGVLPIAFVAARRPT
ncbi:MAG: class I SAM-dependent methyltransferase [Deltaproteobacteria bacterium]|nr:class I SAM-dependent methyltransferase [Deltaproteobacteria bacterium]